MLTRILFALTSIIISCLQLFSQYRTDDLYLKPIKEHWGIGYYFSGSLSAVNQYNKEETILPGYGGLVELYYNDSERDNLFILGKHRYNTKYENKHIETFELSVGPRIAIAKDENLYADITFGGVFIGYITRYKETLYSNEDYYYYTARHDFGFGFTAAFTKKFPVNKNTELIAKLRILNVISFNKEYYMFVNLNCGAAFNTKKTALKDNSIASHSAITLYTGLNKPDLNIYNDYLLGGSYAIELSYKTSPLIELLLSGTYNNIVQKTKHPFHRHYIISLTGGARFIINETPVSSFLEFGVGYYNYYPQIFNQTEEYHNPSKEYLGIFVGTGIKIKTLSYLDLIAKSNFNMLFTKYGTIPSYITIHGGLRFNL